MILSNLIKIRERRGNQDFVEVHVVLRLGAQLIHNIPTIKVPSVPRCQMWLS